jgi:hypothetical protein
MKLITEFNESNIECIVEKNEKGEKSFKIEGVFAQSEQKNRNARIYPKKTMKSAVDKYVSEQVSKNRAVGELNHPEGPTVNLDKVSHLITDLHFEGNDVIGKASILDTPMGRIVKGLLEGGVNLGVSAPNAFVNGIMEGVDWVWSKGILVAQEICEEQETEIVTPSVRTYSYAEQTREFKNFLSSLKETL